MQKKNSLLSTIKNLLLAEEELMDKENKLRGEETQKKFILGIQPALFDKLEQAVKTTGITRSEWIRSAIIAKLEKSNPTT